MTLRQKLLQPYKRRAYKRAEKKVRKVFGGDIFSKPPETHVLLDRLSDCALIDRMEAGE